MMEEQDGQSHNEVVLEAATWVAGLPATIEAFFALPDEGSRVSEGRENWMRKLHRDFLKMYQLTVEDVPLLVFDSDRMPPFRAFESNT